MTDHHPHRRRIDQILDEEFTSDASALDLDVLRERRDLAEAVERELSYYRRLLHGRMDLIGFEIRRRRGEETRSIIDALPEILAAGLTSGMGDIGDSRHLELQIDLPQITGRREIDAVLEDDALARVREMDEAELDATQEALTEAEAGISERRRQCHTVIDKLQAEIIDRYKRGLADITIS